MNELSGRSSRKFWSGGKDLTGVKDELVGV